ncbi:MAG: hypothetical protein AB1582_14100 [Pseudomonadota bacterium]
MSGAPFAYKTTNIPVLDLFARNGGLKDILAAQDPDGLVVDLDSVDDRMDVTLPGAGLRGIELLIHQTCERVDLSGIDNGCCTALGAGLVQRRFGAFPLGFESGGTFPQNVVEFDDAVLDRAVEPLQPVLGIAKLPLQVKQPLVGGCALGGLPLRQRFQEVRDPVGRQYALL